MRKRRKNEALWIVVADVQSQLARCHDTVVSFGREAIAPGGTTQYRDLYEQGRAETRAAAQTIEKLAHDAPPTRWLGEQVVALSLMVTSIRYGMVASGSDEQFLAEVVRDSDELYRHHLLVLEALRDSEGQAIEVLALLRRNAHPGSKVDINQLCVAVRPLAGRLTSDL